MNGAIDKLDVRIPALTRFMPMFRDLESELRMTGAVKSLGKFHRTENYRAAGDLRDFGVPAIAHLGYSRKGEANHKLELVDTGAMGYSEILDTIERVFEIDPRKAETMRVDLCADVPDIPVTWFKEHCRPQYKRFGAEYEDLKTVSMGRCGVETFNYGKRPSFFRIYNKIAEWKYNYAKKLQAARRAQKQIMVARSEGIPDEMLAADPVAALKPFEEMYGYPDTGLTLTRVERQIAGGRDRIPEQVSRVGKLVAIADYNPYERLDIMPGGVPEPSKDAYDIDTYMAGMWLRERIKTEGRLHVHTWLNDATNGHATRTMQTYKDFMPPCESVVSREQIYGLYRDSVSRQLAA